MFRPFALLLTFLSLALASAPTSFCKCTCSTNSSIIPLTAEHTCADCNKQFCLDYNLPICADAKEEEVVTSCFQRESFKDEVIVVVFIAGTVGLLVWAAVRPVWERRRGYGVVGGT